MTPDVFIQKITAQFPQFSTLTFQEIEKIKQIGGDIKPYYDNAWLECFADVINDEMKKPNFNSDVVEVFEFFHQIYLEGNEKINSLIHTSFIILLFWETNQNTKSYWEKLPLTLQQLYIDCYEKKAYE